MYIIRATYILRHDVFPEHMLRKIVWRVFSSSISLTELDTRNRLRYRQGFPANSRSFNGFGLSQAPDNPES